MFYFNCQLKEELLPRLRCQWSISAFIFAFDAVSVLARLREARQGSPLKTCSFLFFLFFSSLSLSRIPTPSCQHLLNLPCHPMWNVATQCLEPFCTWVWIFCCFAVGFCGCSAVAQGPGGLSVQEVRVWESETMAVQLVPDSALSLLMVSAWEEVGPGQRPAPASPHHTPHTMGCCSCCFSSCRHVQNLCFIPHTVLKRFLKSLSYDKALPGKRSLRFAILETCCLMLFWEMSLQTGAESLRK